MTRHAGTILLIGALMVSALSCRQTQIFNPRIEFESRESDTVRKAILKALANREWIVRASEPGAITGVLNIRDHQATISISYAPDFYSIRYVASTELLYERKSDGSELIHEHYNDWIANLVNDTNAALGLPRFDDDRIVQPEAWVGPEGAKAAVEEMHECIRQLGKAREQQGRYAKLLHLSTCMRNKGYRLS
jgi:hypothetical protein